MDRHAYDSFQCQLFLKYSASLPDAYSLLVYTSSRRSPTVLHCNINTDDNPLGIFFPTLLSPLSHVELFLAMSFILVSGVELAAPACVVAVTPSGPVSGHQDRWRRCVDPFCGWEKRFILFSFINFVCPMREMGKPSEALLVVCRVCWLSSRPSRSISSSGSPARARGTSWCSFCTVEAVKSHSVVLVSQPAVVSFENFWN